MGETRPRALVINNSYLKLPGSTVLPAPSPNMSPHTPFDSRQPPPRARPHRSKSCSTPLRCRRQARRRHQSPCGLAYPPRLASSSSAGYHMTVTSMWHSCLRLVCTRVGCDMRWPHRTSLGQCASQWYMPPAPRVYYMYTFVLSDSCSQASRTWY